MNRKEIKFSVVKGFPWIMFVEIEGMRVKEYSLVNLPSRPKKLLTGDFAEIYFYSDKSKGMKAAYQKFTEEVGLPPSKYIKLVRGKYYHLVIKPLKKFLGDHLVRKYTITSPGGVTRINPTKLRKLIIARYKVKQAQEDGLNNLIPLIIETDKNPKELRDIFGKSLWKSLTKNSEYRNSKIAEFLSPIIVTHPTLDFLKKYFRDPEISSFLKTTPASKISIRGFSSRFLARHGNVFINNLSTRTIREVGSFVLTDLSLELEQVDVSPLWNRLKGAGDVLKFHSQLSETIRWKNDFNALSSSPYESLSWIKDKEGEYEGVRWKIIESNRDLYKEAEEMKHCVYSFRDSIESGRYIVMSLEYDGERATAGFSIQSMENETHGTGLNLWMLQQLYGKMNSPVQSPQIRGCAEFMLSHLLSMQSRYSSIQKEAA